MRRVLYSLIISICLIPNIINALECNASDKERLQKLANNISVVVEEKVDENGNISFTATFAGVSQELRVFMPTKVTFYHNMTGSYMGYFNVENLETGITYNFNVYGENTCVYNTLRNITIDIPNYNPYYSDPICENAREHKLCQKWTNNNGISYEKFTSEIESYIKEKKKNNNPIQSSSSDQFDFDFGKFYKMVYFPSLVVTLILIGLLIYFWSKENRKNKL